MLVLLQYVSWVSVHRVSRVISVWPSTLSVPHLNHVSVRAPRASSNGQPTAVCHSFTHQHYDTTITHTDPTLAINSNLTPVGWLVDWLVGFQRRFRHRKGHIMSVKRTYNHRRMGVQPCVNGDTSFQWEVL